MAEKRTADGAATEGLQRRALLKTLPVLALPSGWAGAQAQPAAYPARPITIVVSAPPGGQADMIARYLGEHLTRSLGQPVIVDNKVGASGIIGMQYAAKRPADGYTLVYGAASWIAVNPGFFPNLPYDPAKDFIAITPFGVAPQALLVGAHVPAKTLAEFVGLAKSKPGALTYASFGIGTTSHLQAALLGKLAGIDMLHVPFKGAAQAMQEVVAGRVDCFIIDFAVSGMFVKDGRVRPLALTGTMRTPEYPDVPTFNELGYALTLVGWNGMFAPTGTPRDLVALLNQKINAIIQTPAGREKITQLGLIPTSSPQDAFQKVVLEDIARWRDLIQQTGAKPE